MINIKSLMPSRLTFGCLAFVLLAESLQNGASAPVPMQNPRFITISNIRKISPNNYGFQFSWGRGSQLFYVHHHPSNWFLYMMDVSNNQEEVITVGTSPAFRQYSDHDSIYFLRDTGYSIEKELWRFDRYLQLRSTVQREHKESGGAVMAEGGIFVSPVDDHLFAYRYFGSAAEGGFGQIRITSFGRYGEPSAETGILYSTREEEVPSISGWLDENTLVCFMDNQPFLLKANFEYRLDQPNDGWRHYPNNNSGSFVRGLRGRQELMLPASNFAPDGRSYLVSSSDGNSIRQRDLNGHEIGMTKLPSTLKFNPLGPANPVFSRDGRHLAFVGSTAEIPVMGVPSIYVADVTATVH